MLQFILLSFSFLLQIISFSYGQDAPKLIPMVHSHTIEGEKFILQCSVRKGSEPLFFQWIKDGKLVDDKTVEVVSTSTIGSSLVIQRVSYKDHGNYTCVVRNSFGEDSQTTKLTVKVPLKWSIEPKDVTVVSGSTNVINCTTEGFPKAKIKWIKKANDQIISNEEKLVFDNVIVKDNGLYECVADNGVDTPLSKTIKVSVLVPAKFEEKYAYVKEKSGESVKLSCLATGDQPLTVSWTKDNKPLDKRGADNYDIFDHVTENGLNSLLVIRSGKRNDGGIYKCVAQNEYGKDERTIKLAIIEVPGAPKNIMVKETWSRSANIMWSAPYDGNSPITRYIVQYWLHQSSTRKLNEIYVLNTQTSALVKDLKPGNAYELTVIAENEVGRGDTPESITLYTNQEEPSVAPIDVTVEPKGKTTIKVTWKAPPADHWNGELHGYYVGYKMQGSQQPFSLHTVKAIPNANSAYKYEHYIRNLLKGTAYTVTVKAFNNAGSGPYSHEIRAQTFDGDLPDSPHLTISSSTKTSITVHWTHPRSVDQSERLNVVSYTVHYRRENEDWRQIAVPTSLSSTISPPDDPDIQNFLGTSFTLTNLDPGTKYTIFVTAANTFGIGDPSNIVVTSTNGERFFLSTSREGFDDIPYYFQPMFAIPIITAIVIVVIVLVITYVCVQKIKARYETSDIAAFNTLTSKHCSYNGTTQRYVGLESAKPLMTESGHIYPLPYATLPVGAKHPEDFSQKPWDRPLPNPKAVQVTVRDSHIYDNPQ